MAWPASLVLHPLRFTRERLPDEVHLVYAYIYVLYRNKSMGVLSHEHSETETPHVFLDEVLTLCPGESSHWEFGHLSTSNLGALLQLEVRGWQEHTDVQISCLLVQIATC